MGMANVQMPFGLEPVKHLFGGTIRLSRYYIADQYATALYQGDPVIVTGAGSTSGGRVIGIATATGANKITGVFRGCRYVDVNGDTKFSKFWPASTITKTQYPIIAYVVDDPGVLYRVQSDVTGISNATLANGAALASGVGSALTGQSGWCIGTLAAAANKQFIIEGLDESYRFPGGLLNTYGAYAVALGQINQGQISFLNATGV